MFIVVVAFWVFFFIFCLPFLCASSFFMNCHGTDIFPMHVCNYVYVCVWVKAFHVYDSVLFALVWFGIAKVHFAEYEWFECQHWNDIIYRFLFQNSHIQCLKGEAKRKKYMISSFYFDSIFEWKETEWAKNKVSDDTKTTEKLPEFDEMGKTMRMKWNVLIKWKGNSYTLIYAHILYKDRHK